MGCCVQVRPCSQAPHSASNKTPYISDAGNFVTRGMNHATAFVASQSSSSEGTTHAVEDNGSVSDPPDSDDDDDDEETSQVPYCVCLLFFSCCFLPFNCLCLCFAVPPLP